MTSGKLLRLRRIFANGRALIVDCSTFHEDSVAKIRASARAGVDAVILTPGLLDEVADELGSVAVIVRLDRLHPRTPLLVSVESALEMGAEGVVLSLGPGDAKEREAIELFVRAAEDCRRFGMPLFAEMAGEDWLETARLCASYGSDIVHAPFNPAQYSYRKFVGLPGAKFVLSLPDSGIPQIELLSGIHTAMQGAAQGLVLPYESLAGDGLEPFLRAAGGLIRQGVPLEEALDGLKSRIEVAEAGNESGGGRINI